MGSHTGGGYQSGDIRLNCDLICTGKATGIWVTNNNPECMLSWDYDVCGSLSAK